jgi:hypothetical protein
MAHLYITKNEAAPPFAVFERHVRANNHARRKRMPVDGCRHRDFAVELRLNARVASSNANVDGKTPLIVLLVSLCVSLTPTIALKGAVSEVVHAPVGVALTWPAVLMCRH